MKFPPSVTLTSTIQRLLYDLDVLKSSYALRPVSSDRETHLKRESLLKSSLYSARIEGNTLTLEDVHNLGLNERDQKKIEVFNLLQAYEHIGKQSEKSMSLDVLRDLHRMVVHEISRDAGFFRTEESAIYNQAGVAVYLTPAPQNVISLLKSLCDYIHELEDPAPVVAGVAHIWFEKIHPFLDGNGRVGRLLSSLILKKSGYDLYGLVPFEEYLDNNRDLYYDQLGKDRQDVTEFVEFYLQALVAQGKESLHRAYEVAPHDPYANLLPRRAEIMRIVADHKTVTFDFLARRFRAVPTRTLHNDFTQLVKAKLLIKMGSTRGVVYKVGLK